MAVITERLENLARPGYSGVPRPDALAVEPQGCEYWFERILWSSRLVVLLAVVASVAVAFAMFFIATVDTVTHVWNIWTYTLEPNDSALHDKLRTDTIEHIVESVDGYLLATVLLIFAFGLYELFISRINVAEKNDRATRILMIHSLDDLKHRLGQVVLLILVVKFFEGALAFTITSVNDILGFSGGVLLISVALYLTHKHAPPEPKANVSELSENGGHSPRVSAESLAGSRED